MMFGVPDWFWVVLAIVLIGHLALKIFTMVFVKAVMSSPEVKAAMKKAGELKKTDKDGDLILFNSPGSEKK